ncbi:GILT-like protein 1 [Coccinella septempunctata]|uniref:GILT-like protein 1 n=1 Tax=Coccinella septempunctata TaxID=41139 RepID=UPI001D095F03|nr:GILT-like protein 1 [Coccinella septempunctata]
MSKLMVFLAVLAAAHAQAEHDHHSHEEHRISVAVYYEALCPDSIKFFTKQLYPTLIDPNLGHYINLTLVPYGKSTTTDDNGQIKFDCHHGEGECRGNKLQACALKHIEDGKNSEGLGFNKMTAAFINCLMGTVERKANDTKYPTESCAQMSNVTIVPALEKCQGDAEGSSLLKELGEITNKLNPKLTSVPTIVFNNEQKEEESKLANDNFVKALCKHIQGTKPMVCNGAAFLGLNSLLVLFALVSYFF